MWKPESRFSYRKRHRWESTKPWLEGVSYVAQVCAVVLALYGYVHTVLPVFQKEKLEEELARLELQQESERSELARLRRLQAAADEGLKTSLHDVAVARSVAQRAQDSAHQQSVRALSLAKQNDAYEAIIKSAKGSIIALQWDQFVQSLGIGIVMPTNSAYNYYKMAPWLRDGPTSPPQWPDPVADALRLVDEMKVFVPKDNRDAIAFAAKAYIRDHHDLLVCPPPDGFVAHVPNLENDPVRGAARLCSSRVSDFGEHMMGLKWDQVSRLH